MVFLANIYNSIRKGIIDRKTWEKDQLERRISFLKRDLRNLQETNNLSIMYDWRAVNSKKIEKIEVKLDCYSYMKSKILRLYEKEIQKWEKELKRIQR